MTRDEDTYLSADEIRRITRRTYAKAQCKMLSELGWPFQPDGEGRPLVLRAVHDERMGLKSTTKRRRPRLEGLSA